MLHIILCLPSPLFNDADYRQKYFYTKKMLRIGQSIRQKNESGVVVHLSPPIMKTTQNFYVVITPDYEYSGEHNPDVHALDNISLIERIKRFVKQSQILVADVDKDDFPTGKS